MKQTTLKPRDTWFLIVASVLILGAALSGCQKSSNPAQPTSEASASTNQDAALSVASAVSENNGGALDQMGDAADLSCGLRIRGDSEGLMWKHGVGMGMGFGHGHGIVDTTYDPVTAWWTANLTRTRGSEDGNYSATLTRTYQYQFLDKNGQLQKYWKVTNAGGTVDTAYSIHFKIIRGSGEHHTPRISAHLTSLSGDWMVTGTNTRTITINGTYARTGVDTVMRHDAMRTLSYSLDLTFTNVTGPRTGREEFSRKTSGTITGTYAGLATYTKGNEHSEQTISRTINITFSGSGRGGIDVDNDHFPFDSSLGDLDEDD